MAKRNENGNRGEKLLCKYLHQKNYWCHRLAKNERGSQPFDVIAIGLNLVWCLDAKYVEEGKSFRLSRAEENQENAMKMLKEFARYTGMERVGFVIFFECDIEHPRFLDYYAYTEAIAEGKKSLNMNELYKFEYEL